MVIQDHYHVDKEEIMEENKKEELLNIVGGAISGTLINAFAKSITVLLDLGRSFGTAIRRISSNKVCSL